MLKSTHRPTAPAPLPGGWTEHKAPTGHTYYYNTATKQSTYTRPIAPPAGPIAPSPPAVSDPSQSFLQYQAIRGPIPSAGTASTNLALPDQFQGEQRKFQGQGQRDGRGGHDRPRGSRPQPVDKPTSRYPILGHEPWVLVHTKYGRRFVYNTEKNQSYWRIPEKLKDGILALDQSRIKEKAEALLKGSETNGTTNDPGAAARPTLFTNQPGQGGSDERDDDSSEYEEVEVTDDEDEDMDGENTTKRQRTDDATEEPVEFNEDDIAFQLAAMGQEYGLDPGEYDDGGMEEWNDNAEVMEMKYEDSAALFKDLLNDCGINPYSPWEKLVEEGKLVDDIRYTALPNMKARREVWEEWSRLQIKQLRELRAREEKKDPRISYLAFLQNHANPKLYWPEFKRKYKREPEMRDPSLSDRDREKFYRDHICRLKLPQSTLKSDLLDLLKSQPSSTLNNTTLASNLPPSVIADINYISIDPSTRDPLIETYLTTLPPPPEFAFEQEDVEAAKERKDKEGRQKALEDRERRVAEQKRRQKRDLELGKGRLRDEEAELARAMNVTKKGLKDHLMAEDGAGNPA
ncbi:FF protein [Venustampulla echinocandica]|uniref:FF protein n=1 Tax=Venustampulla echinocandica TaxID=2656787 RepID=A0A370TN67_9HELO|nr:FF protein [Venustampulla echinocandica]RDL36959.1 FF protein [Venustampulla echinocandica]